MPEPTGFVAGPKEYEAIYILRPDIDPELAEKVSSRVADVIQKQAGTLTKVESWGRRKLAYPVRKFRKGVYFYVRFVGKGDSVSELERNLRMQKDAVLKFLTVKVRDDVQVESLEVNPEEIQFAPVEAIAPEELEESRERLLGLVEEPRHYEMRRRHEDVDEDLEDGDGVGSDQSPNEEE